MKEKTGPGNRTRVGVVSLGCAKNLVDTEVMLGHLDKAGCRFVEDAAEAELIVVNTCSFIGPAREESIRTILEAAELKTSGNLKRLVVAGCMVQRYAGELRESLPEVDAFVGLDELDRIAERGGLADAPEAAVPDSALLQIGEPARFLYDDRTPRHRATPSWSAFLKIAEGCDHTCSFCAIPAFRGAFRSRQPDSVVREAAKMASQGVAEINLIAQDSSHYGRDLEMREGLSELLKRLDSVEGLRWIRLHYLYPNTVTDTLIETMARLPRVVNYVDIPLQHAHPETLRRMRRGGDAERHLELLARFRRGMPDASLRSTFIVGFPGESDEEFAALLAFVREVRFDHLGVFRYSHEEQTTAHDLDDDVPETIKQQRHDELMAVQQQIVFERNASWIGREVEALIEGPHPETEHLLVARHCGQAAEVDGQILIQDGFAPPGSFVDVELTETAGYDLVGRILDGAGRREGNA